MIEQIDFLLKLLYSIWITKYLLTYNIEKMWKNYSKQHLPSHSEFMSMF